MLWEVEIHPLGRDGERDRVCDEFDRLTSSTRGGDLVTATSRGYLLDAALDAAGVRELGDELLVDRLVERYDVRPLGTLFETPALTVLLKPGVTDPAAASVVEGANDLKYAVSQVRTFRRYYGPPDATADRELLTRKVLANAAIELVLTGPPQAENLALGTPYVFKLVVVPLRDLGDDALVKISRDGQLALTLEEMKAVQAHFAAEGRDPTDCELETVAQTWSEHCSHKTLKGVIELAETVNGVTTTRRYGNLLKETIFAATQQIRRDLGENDWCVSVFSDNAGVVKFCDTHHLAIKVETHNRPSSIEPYGGANTGLGGVIRDVLGTALGGKPVANTDVFCFARPDFPADQLPPGVLHPRRVMQGVVAGVRDYGNRMGIPTVNGSLAFDDRYLANPLVFCGTVGTVPVDKVEKQVMPGDLIVAVGGRTGRDGIHGATFSSLELTDQSETLSGGAVQIGNAIEEKKVLDALLKARDRGLYTALTDCGAGGFSSAVGEMGADLGADVHLEKAPLKYAGLSYSEVWISEAQERMVLSVPPAKWPELHDLCHAEGVEAVTLGTFEATGRLKLSYQETVVGDLPMHFLHDGRPDSARAATFTAKPPAPVTGDSAMTPQDALVAVLGSWTVCSKEGVVRQYDHEVQGGSVVKPLVGVLNDGPSDAAVITPVLGLTLGAAIGHGLCPQYADLDPHAAALCAVDEALRNVVAVGAAPAFAAILDNFCWGNVADPELLGALVRTAEACRDAALAYRTPFVSGKDSLNNEYKSPTQRITIPPTLLVTALARVPDITRCVTMDLKQAGNRLLLVGETHDHLGGSHYHLVTGRNGGRVPCPDLSTAPKLLAAVHAAISAGLVRSCHDLSEGGLVVAAAEMAFAGGVGADLTGLKSAPGMAGLPDPTRLFSETPTRFLVEVTPDHLTAFNATLVGHPVAEVGVTVSEQRLRIAGDGGEWLVWAKLGDLKEAWQKPLRD